MTYEGTWPLYNLSLPATIKLPCTLSHLLSDVLTKLMFIQISHFQTTIKVFCTHSIVWCFYEADVYTNPSLPDSYEIVLYLFIQILHSQTTIKLSCTVYKNLSLSDNYKIVLYSLSVVWCWWNWCLYKYLLPGCLNFPHNFSSTFKYLLPIFPHEASFSITQLYILTTAIIFFRKGYDLHGHQWIC